MYLRRFKRILKVQPSGILHIGAHKAEELQEYELNNFYGTGMMYWVEGQSRLAQELRLKLDKTRNVVIEAYAWNVDNEEMTFKVTNKSASPSLFDLDQHKVEYPDIYVEEIIKIHTSRLDSVLPKDAKFDYVAIDVQGSELMALEGLGGFMAQVKWIFTEVSRKNLYMNAPLVGEIDGYLLNKGFRRKFTAWDRKAGWGDALYIHQSVANLNFVSRLKSIIWTISRLLRSRIPQFLFPVLVKIKNKCKNLARK